ncbi:transcriptional regulator [Kluyvera intermedia]|uniref:transcriptional regulator n=1 Tax=Kluyvera intermedia TaxID=61648 RepID=UPI00372D25C9
MPARLQAAPQARLSSTTKKISGPLSTLLADDLIAFEGKHGQRLYHLTDYSIRYAPETMPDIQQGKSKLVQQTEANVICQECRNSAVVKRVFAFYGAA